MWWRKILSSCKRHEKELGTLAEEAPEGDPTRIDVPWGALVMART